MLKKDKFILAIESSCDETSVAIVKNGNEILSHFIATQIKSHQRFGGVVPEVASRHHIEEITIGIKRALSDANFKVSNLTAVAVTYGPGLVGSLLVGINAAKSLSCEYHLPLIGVNHMAGHIYAANYVKKLQFPLLALLVSGGHTELVYMPQRYKFKILGTTRDDAAGEVFDKVGRVLGLAYPAGKAIDELSKSGSDTFHFPRAMIKDDNYDFSFSGLKSAFINTVHNADQVGKKLNKNDLLASFQNSVVDVLTTKTEKAINEFSGIKQFVLAGGVAANSQLRASLSNLIKDYPNIDFIPAPLKLCGDNAAMIGAAAYDQFLQGNFSHLDLNAVPNLSFEHY